MAKLRIFKKVSGFNLPKNYTFRKYDQEDKSSFIAPIDSEAKDCEKYAIGRWVEKEYSIKKPTKEGLKDVTYTKPRWFMCNVYIPKGEDKIFMVGHDSEVLIPELEDFSGQETKGVAVDLEKLEEKSFSSGKISLIGHRYKDRGYTLSYTVRKIDGTGFRKGDPDYKRYKDCDDKDVLEIQLDLDEDNSAKFHVHANGKVTRRGSKGDTLFLSEFELLRIVYDIIKGFIS
jgi:hypothetical protein